MPSFRHKRTGKVVTVSDRDAHRYRGTNFEPVADPDDLEVPTGSVDEVLAWAGDDPARRAAALKAEQASSRPRKGILSSLGG